MARGRKPDFDEPMCRTGMWISTSWFDAIATDAIHRGMSVSARFRLLLEHYSEMTKHLGILIEHKMFLEKRIHELEQQHSSLDPAEFEEVMLALRRKMIEAGFDAD
jgi:hypothetical protein